MLILRHIQKKYTEARKKLSHIFIELEKAFDRVPRSAIEWALGLQLIPGKLVSQLPGARRTVQDNSRAAPRFRSGPSAVPPCDGASYQGVKAGSSMICALR